MEKVLICINNFKIGGAERVASIIANYMCDKYEVHAVIGDDDINYPIDSRVSIHVLYGKNWPKFLKVPVKLIQYIRLVNRIFPDYLYAFANSSAIYGAFCKLILKKSVTLISSERTDPTREPRNYFAVKLRDWAYSYSDYLVCQTPWVKDYFERRIKTKCVVIPNPITPNLPQWKGQNSNVILTACRLEPQKNLPLLIEAFDRLHKEFGDLKLIIYGDGYLRNQLQNLIDSKGLSDYIEMPGFINNLHDKMVNARMYVSSSDYEGISNSMIEALGIGLPIIHTDCPVGGASMFIKNGISGLLVPIRDTDALYRAMKRMYEDKELSVNCSRNSICVNRELEIGVITKKWLNLASSKIYQF